MFKFIQLLLASGFLMLSPIAYAVETAAVTPSPTTGVFKMLIGLAVVLLILAVIAWAMKKMMGNVPGNQSVIRTIGGVSVGTRERVVVLEVAGRWLVVGVASGQVSSLANLDAGDLDAVSQYKNTESTNVDLQQSKNTPVFSKWLKASTAKITEKQDG